MADTVRGLIVLGLDETNARYASYALHAVFRCVPLLPSSCYCDIVVSEYLCVVVTSYPTSESWIPSTDTTVPIHINKMKNTRWGKNWGSYERIDWCSDMDINQFFE